MNEIVKMDAWQVVSLLKKREISPLELIDICENRINEVENSVNAMPTLCLDRARKYAENIMVNPPHDPSPGYLYGLPIAIKDLTDVKGVRTTYGSTIFSDHVPDSSDYLVDILEANGAIVIGKTNTPEFGAGGNTFNDVFGPTLNPWNLKLTCGGSSGGSAVALATGEVWLAAGSDLAGSLRTPASYCSIVGLRPSPGRVPMGPKKVLYDTLGVQGPMARNVKDAALMLDAQVGYHSGDPISLLSNRETYLNIVETPLIPERIGFSPDLGITPVDSETKKICLKAVGSLEKIGVSTEENFPDFSHAKEIFQTLRALFYANHFAPLLENHRDQLKPEVVWNIEEGLSLSIDKIVKIEQLRAELYYSTIGFFEDHDLLVCPTVVAPPFDVNVRYLEQLDGFKFDTYVDWLVLTYALTLTGCPCISIPGGFTNSGLPVGIQLMGPPRREDSVLSAAAILENEISLVEKTPMTPRATNSH